MPPPGYGTRPSTPPPTSANASGGIPRQSTPPPTSANASGGIPRQGDTFNPPTVRGILPQPTPGTQPPGFDEASAFRDACALMEAKNWTGARQAFHALAAKVPQSKQYRAWLCYTRGREAYLAGRVEDAIVELQRALQLEPDHAHAKHALAELQRRR
jgi:tetratricopeptide (TPR) repeat protein